jgi:aminoglycoside 3-N-acetyltransferase
MRDFPFKADIKRLVRKARLAYQRRFQAFGPAELDRMLARLGIVAGDVVMVHSAFDKFSAFTGKPLDAIRVLQERVGPTGLLTMPTLPFGGTAIAWAEEKKVFDVRRTPSQVGLLTEMFRRMPGVVRSVHPTHSVAAWGARADEFVAGHHAAATPCGAGTPYARLAERNGKILFLGTGIDVITYFHTVEEELEALMPFTPFTREVYVMISQDAAGQRVETRTRLFDPAVSRRRNMGILVPVLKAQGAWREARVGTLDAILLSARDVSRIARSMAERGEFCYDRGQ